MQIIKKFIIFILTVESRLIIKRYKPFIIAVTGSVGKTATKDAIFCALSSYGHVRKSEKSLNSEIGLPLTIIGVPTAWRNLGGWIKNIYTGLEIIFARRSEVNYPEVLVLEIGADHPGDIKKVTKWLHPDIAVITRVGDKPVHVEFFKSPEQVFEEKSALAYAVKSGGSVVLYADEPKIVELGKSITDKQKNVSVVTFGLSETASVRGLNYKTVYENNVPTGFSFDVSFDQKNIPMIVNKVIGQTFMYPILAGVAVSKAKGLDIDTIVKNVSAYEAPKGRMNIVKGINNSTLIDDTYNSSPDAVIAALGTLKDLQCTGRKIAVLGDMMELGHYSAEEHRHIGKIISGYADMLVTVGPRAKAIADEAVSNGMNIEMVSSYSSSIEAGEALVNVVKEGDIVLVKGSQSVRLERVSRSLLREPEKADRLLVRQEKEWLEKK